MGLVSTAKEKTCHMGESLTHESAVPNNSVPVRRISALAAIQAVRRAGDITTPNVFRWLSRLSSDVVFALNVESSETAAAFAGAKSRAYLTRRAATVRQSQSLRLAAASNSWRPSLIPTTTLPNQFCMTRRLRTYICDCGSHLGARRELVE